MPKFATFFAVWGYVTVSGMSFQQNKGSGSKLTLQQTSTTSSTNLTTTAVRKGMIGPISLYKIKTDDSRYSSNNNLYLLILQKGEKREEGGD